MIIDNDCILVISDIHGHGDILVNLLTEDAVKSARHTYILGNVIGYGNENKLTLQYLMHLKNLFEEKITFLKGSHEEVLINAIVKTPRDFQSEYFISKLHLEQVEDYLRTDSELLKLLSQYWGLSKTVCNDRQYILSHGCIESHIIDKQTNIKDLLAEAKESKIVTKWGTLSRPLWFGSDYKYEMQYIETPFTLISGDFPSRWCFNDGRKDQPYTTSHYINVDMGAKLPDGYLGMFILNDNGSRAIRKKALKNTIQ